MPIGKLLIGDIVTDYPCHNTRWQLVELGDKTNTWVCIYPPAYAYSTAELGKDWIPGVIGSNEPWQLELDEFEQWVREIREDAAIKV